MSSWQRPFVEMGRVIAGGDAFVVGMGSSLAEFKWARIEGLFTIALNNAVLHVPKASIHIYADANIWKRYKPEVYDPGTKIVVQKGAYDEIYKNHGAELKDQLYEFKQLGRPELKDGPKDIELYVSRTVATAGIQLAWRLGARRIFLLGVDGYRRKDGKYYADGTTKAVERAKLTTDKETGNSVEQRHTQWGEEMGRVRKAFNAGMLYPGPYPGAGIYNLSEHSTIPAWEKVDVDSILPGGSDG